MAIARDNNLYFSYTGTTSGNQPYAIGGTNTSLVAFTVNEGGTNDINAPTFNSVALTEIGTAVQNGTSGRYLRGWILVNAPVGTFNFVSTRGSSNSTQVVLASWSDVLQSAPDNQNTAQFASGSVSPATISLTPVANNCWVILAVHAERALTAGTGSNLVNGTASSFQIFDSDAPITPAASYSMSFSQSADTGTVCAKYLSIAPRTITIVSSELQLSTDIVTEQIGLIATDVSTSNDTVAPKVGWATTTKSVTTWTTQPKS